MCNHVFSNEKHMVTMLADFVTHFQEKYVLFLFGLISIVNPQEFNNIQTIFLTFGVSCLQINSLLNKTSLEASLVFNQVTSGNVN